MSEAEDIVKAILEADDLDFDLGDKDATMPDEHYWEQIGGDYGDPWVYGGTWWNPLQRNLAHFEGIEYEKEVEPENVEVPPYTLAKIKAMVHDPDLDEEWAKEDPAWLEKELKQEEWEVERKVGEYQYAKAAFLNARKPYQFEFIELERFTDELPSSLARHAQETKAQFSEEAQAEFDSWPIHIQAAEILNYIGWSQHYDWVDHMSKKDAEAFFHFKL